MIICNVEKYFSQTFTVFINVFPLFYSYVVNLCILLDDNKMWYVAKSVLILI